MRILLASLWLTSAIPPAAGQAASFTALGGLPGGRFYSDAYDVSEDGSVVVGVGWSETNQEAFRWTADGGMIGLGVLPGVTATYALRTSADGAVIVGWGRRDATTLALRWTQASGLMDLGDFPGGPTDSSAYDVSADGSVVVGSGYTASGREQAFRWTESGGMVGLGFLQGGTSSVATGVSADGSTIVGTAIAGFYSRAFRWTASERMVDLGVLPGANFESHASGVSRDGSVVVGWGRSGPGHEAFRWTAAGVMVGLGFLPGLDSTFAQDVSPDGSRVVGYAQTSTGPRKAFLWDAEHGMRAMEDVLAEDHGLDLTGWTLSTATAFSSQGHIVGTGFDPDGNSQAWIADTRPSPVVQIDIAPDADANPINLAGGHPLQVVILGSDTIDVAEVDGVTLRFGPSAAAPAVDLTDPSLLPLFRIDVNDDDHLDLVVLFGVQQTGLTLEHTEACLEGEIAGQPFEACDVVTPFFESIPACGLGFEVVGVLLPLRSLVRPRRRQ